MSDVARFWSRHLHGLNFAEHAVCRELAEHHNEEKDECFPNMNTICDIYECSRRYVKEILTRLDTWQLVTRVEWYEPDSRTSKMRQTANRYKLNLKRNFPDPIPEGRTTKDKNKQQEARPYDNRDHAALDGAKQGRRVLKILANRIPQHRLHIMEGLTQAYLDRPAKTTFVTVAAESYFRDFLELLPDLSKFVRHETNLETSLTAVPLFFRLKKR
jgi:hypothetical protein